MEPFSELRQCLLTGDEQGDGVLVSQPKIFDLSRQVGGIIRQECQSRRVPLGIAVLKGPEDGQRKGDGR